MFKSSQAAKQERSETRCLTILGQRIEVQMSGIQRPEAPTLVFLHDGLGSAASWADLPAYLAAITGWRAVAYSRAGHGASGPRAIVRSCGFMHVEAAMVLPALLAALEIRRPILIGHSDGASIALIYAGVERDVRGVVALAPHLFVEDRTVAEIARLRDRLRERTARARLRELHGGNTDALVVDWTHVWLSSAFRGWNIEGVVEGVRCPVLLLQGERDEYGTSAQIDRARSLLGARARAEILPDADHFPHRSQRAATLAAIESFLLSLEE